MYSKFHISINLIFVVLLAALVVSLAGAVFSFGGRASSAYAAEGDSFEVVYPTANYFQSQTPTLVAANANYLLVLDVPENRLYVRDKDLSTFFYDISSILTSADAGGDAPAQKPVGGIYAVGSHAFIAVGIAPEFEIYSLDLSSGDAQAVQKEIASPDHIDCFASDGEKLYAKNAAGYVTSYDENAQIVKQDIYNYEVTPGQASIAGDDGVIYLFTTDNKNTAKLYVYDSNSDSVLLKRDSRFVQSAYIGDVIYAQISPSEDIENHSKIICLDKQTGEELYTSNFMPESFCAYGDKLYSINNGSVTGYRFKLAADGEYALEPEETISMAGSDFKHLNFPADLLASKDALLIADKENMRLAAVDMSDASAPITPYPLDGSPVRLTASEDRIYVLFENYGVSVFDVSDGALTAAGTFNAPQDGDPIPIVDMLCFDGDLYAISSDALYMFIANTFMHVADLTGAKRLATTKNGASMYVLTENEIIMMGDNGSRLPSKLLGDFADATDIAADFAGNLFVLYENKVIGYKNRVRSLEQLFEIELTSAYCKATATSCALLGDSLYFGARECFVGKLGVEAVDSDGYTPPALPIPDDDTQYHFAKLNDGANSYFIPAADGRADRMIPANSDVLLILDSFGSPEEGLSYAMDGDALYLVPDEDLEVVTPTSLENKAYLAKEDGTAYTIPYFDQARAEILEGSRGIRAISDCAGYDNNAWWIVSYNGKTYFVEHSLLEEDLSPPPPDDPDDPQDEVKAVFGRAKARRVGGTVNIYSDSDESEVLASIVDGKKVEILQTLDDYYQVKYGEVVGFMRTSEVKIGGLTTVQIVAIVVSAAVLVAGTGIFISIYSIKKKKDAEEK